MNIFRSKLPHVQFHNDNLGGVNYQLLKEQEQEQEQEGGEDMPNRKRTSTFQDYIEPFYMQEAISYNPLDKETTFSSTSAHYKSDTQSPFKSKDNSSRNNVLDIDEQFR